MTILALDPANILGYWHTDGYRGSLPLTRSVDRFPGARLIRLHDWLFETLRNHPTKWIAAEDASRGSNNRNTAASHNELRGVIHYVAAKLKIEVKLFSPSTIKVHGAGHGGADKDAMMRAYRREFKSEPVDENECDARWILNLAGRPDCWPVPKPKRKKRAPKTLPPQRTKRQRGLVF